MKSFTMTAAVVSILFGVCLFVSGCGGSTADKPKMDKPGAMMSSDQKMSGNAMSENKMSTTEKMSDPKMNGMADEKMEKSDATGK